MESIGEKFFGRNVNRLLSDMNVYLRKFDKNTKGVREDTLEMIRELCHIIQRYDIDVDISCVPEEIREEFSEKTGAGFSIVDRKKAMRFIATAPTENLLQNIDDFLESCFESKVDEFVGELCELVYKNFVSDSWLNFKEGLSNDVHEYIIRSFFSDVESMAVDSTISHVNPIDYKGFKEWWESNVERDDMKMDKKYLDIVIKIMFSYYPIPACMRELGKVSEDLVDQRVKAAYRELYERICNSEK